MSFLKITRNENLRMWENGDNCMQPLCSRVLAINQSKIINVEMYKKHSQKEENPSWIIAIELEGGKRFEIEHFTEADATKDFDIVIT